jgi:2-oxoisovalerate dehydrogenase E1 component alpha subunit
MLHNNVTTVASFSVQYRQILDETGKLLEQLPAFASKEQMHKIYYMLCLARSFDTKAIALQRTGKIGTYPSALGQEAIGVAVGAAMQPEDILCPYYREVAAQLWRGTTMEEILHYWGGDEVGSDFKYAKNDFPNCVPIGSQTLHAAGIAKAMQLQNKNTAVVVVIGDGGTSRGDFYESLNVAGVWKLPIVYVINNNQWAISVPRHAQTAAETLAQKGIAGGIKNCLQVDGNDVLVLQSEIKLALSRAYIGEGPTIIEAITYRMCDHTTADDASRYRDPLEMQNYVIKDPILRLKNYLLAERMWDLSQEENLQCKITQNINAAVDVYLSHPKRAPSSMFDYLYAKLPKALHAQVEDINKFAEKSNC